MPLFPVFKRAKCPFCGAVKEQPSLTDDGVDRTGAFAIPDDTPWWIALHQLLKRIEEETVVGARTRVKDTNECISAIGAGEGIALVRRRLAELRAYALSQRPDSKSVL